MNRKTTGTTVALALGLLSAITLAGCSGDAPNGDRTASPSPTAEAAVVDYEKCTDGVRTVLASQAEAGSTVDIEACASVSIVGTPKEDVTFRVGATDHLVVEGSRLTIEAQSVTTLTVPGAENTISYEGQSKVEDLGEGNTVTSR